MKPKITIPRGYMIASAQTHRQVSAKEAETAIRDFRRGDYRKYGIMRTDRAEMTEHEASAVESWLAAMNENKTANSAATP